MKNRQLMQPIFEKIQEQKYAKKHKGIKERVKNDFFTINKYKKTV